MHWVVGDVRDLDCFPEKHFTVVVDKVVSDILACSGRGDGSDDSDGGDGSSEGEGGPSAGVRAAHAEYARLLAPGGVLLVVSGFSAGEVQQHYVGKQLPPPSWGARCAVELPFLPCPQPQNACEGREAEREGRGVLVALRRRDGAACAAGAAEAARDVRLLDILISRLLAIMQDRTWYLEHATAVANATSDDEDEDGALLFVEGPARYADAILTPLEQRAEEVMAELQRLGEREPALSSRYLCPAYWRALMTGCGLQLSEGDPLHTVQGTGAEAAQGPAALEVEAAREMLAERGYFLWERAGAAEGQVPLLAPLLIGALRAGAARIKAAGWPATFLLLMDEPWQLVARLFELLEPVLMLPDMLEQQSENTGEVLELDLDLFVWSLDKGLSDGRYVNGNFATPHRDSPHGANHDSAGRPTQLNVWVPLTDATLTNGCMWVLPKNCDPLFDKPDHPQHMGAATRDPDGSLVCRFPIHHARPLPAPEGAIVAWQSNLVHWGASCAPDAAVHTPRTSMALTLRRRQRGGESTGPTLAQLRDMDVQARLSMVGKSLRMYNHWTKGYTGLDLDQIRAGVADLPMPMPPPPPPPNTSRAQI